MGGQAPPCLMGSLTTPKTSNGETPFCLTYGTEAMVLVEIGSPTRWTRLTQEVNDADLRFNLNMLQERREWAAIKEDKYKKRMEKYYNTRVRKVAFQVGDLVLRENKASNQEPKGKLGLKWEGPYIVVWSNGKGTYKLSYTEGTEIPRTWNIMQLCKYCH
jgi:hypothetical protein